MRTLIVAAVACLAIGCGSDSRSAPTVPVDDTQDDTIDSVLLRMALVVDDVEASKDFYSHVLGYTVGFDGDITRPAVIEQLQLAKGQTAHFVVLRGADSVDGRELNGAMVGLLHIDNPPLPAMQRPGPATLATGEGMMAIVTSDIATVYARAQELDARILLPPMKSADGSESEMVVYDPDGVRIHVVEVHTPRPTD
ncbi:MAG: VOC family protein [Woeseiaceae bacterium]